MNQSALKLGMTHDEESGDLAGFYLPAYERMGQPLSANHFAVTSSVVRQ